jgi:hypothetical protein
LTPDQIHKIADLAKRGMSIANIAKALRTGKSTVYYHARDSCRKMTKLNLNLLDQSEKGYVIGFFLGDGSFNKGRKNPRYVVRFALNARRDRDIARKLTQIFKKGCKKANVFSRGSTLIVKVCSKELEKYVVSFVEYKSNGNTRNEKTFRVDGHWSAEFRFGVLAGLIDSDGHVHGHLGTEMKTVSSSLFKAILTLLATFGIEAKTKTIEATTKSYSKKTCYAIYIPSTLMNAFQNRIPSVKIERCSQTRISPSRKLN